MSAYKFDFDALAESCVKCGKCIPVCTIHAISADETTSPRGFLDLLGAFDRGQLELDKNAKKIFESCFLCTNCVDVCPTRLPTDTAIEEVRAVIAEKYGIAWYKQAFFWLLEYRVVLDILARVGYTVKSCAFAAYPKELSMKSRFWMPIIGSGRLLPSVMKKSFLQSYPDHIDGKNQKVAIFIGCMANYAYTPVGDALVSILKKLEVEIVIPKKQLCCGAPAYFTGDFRTVRSLIKKNIVYFETFIDEIDAIIVPEATCSSMMAIDWSHLLEGEEEWQKRSKKITSKVHLATEWLVKNTKLTQKLKESGKNFDTTVTYHDPCHARKTQGVWKEPRELLSQNYKMVEMENSNRCCGFGGVTMQTNNFHLAQMAGKPKAQMINDTGASIVSAECSACRMQLTNALHENGVSVQFKNPLELINEALS